MPQLLKSPNVKIGNGTLYSADYEDCYFQSSGPINEIEYVFIHGNRLYELWDQCVLSSQPVCVIGETGFGSGLNFIVTWYHWIQWRLLNLHSDLQLHFVSVELFPLLSEQLQAIHSAFPQFQDLSRQLIEAWPPAWEGTHFRQFPDHIALSLLFGDGVDTLSKHSFIADCWYLDGFAPSRNEKMWSQQLYRQLAVHSKLNTRLSTFTAAGHVRRGLEAEGFQLERVPGFNKRHMTIGFYKGNAVPARPMPVKPKIAIIGAGYGGLHLARALKSMNADIHLFDQHSEPVSEASGNFAHVLYVNPRSNGNVFNLFFEQAYSFAVGAYRHDQGVCKTGAFHIIDNLEPWSDELISQTWSTQWLEKIDEQQVESLTGLNMQKQGLWMPHACIIKPYEWSKWLLQQLEPGIHLHFQHRLMDLKHDHDRWVLAFQSNEDRNNKGQLKSDDFDIVLLTTGAGTIDLLGQLGNECIGPDVNKPSHWRYPLRPIAGQSSVIQTRESETVDWPFSRLKTAVCGGAYITPVFEGQQTFGSRFYPDRFAEGINDRDHLENLQELFGALGFACNSNKMLNAVTSGTCATRVQTTDYLPMVGSIFPEYGPGLHAVTGFGAKGSLVAPFVAQIMVQKLFGGAPVVSDAVMKMLEPSRFAQRLIKYSTNSFAGRERLS